MLTLWGLLAHDLRFFKINFMTNICLQVAIKKSFDWLLPWRATDIWSYSQLIHKNAWTEVDLESSKGRWRCSHGTPLGEDAVSKTLDLLHLLALCFLKKIQISMKVNRNSLCTLLPSTKNSSVYFQSFLHFNCFGVYEDGWKGTCRWKISLLELQFFYPSLSWNFEHQLSSVKV